MRMVREFHRSADDAPARFFERSRGERVAAGGDGDDAGGGGGAAGERAAGDGRREKER